MAEHAQLFLTPLAVQEALPAVTSVCIEPMAALSAVRTATGNPELGSSGLSIIVSARAETPPFSVNGTETEFVAAADIRATDPPITPRKELAEGDVIGMRSGDWTADELTLELLGGAQAKARSELREKNVMAVALGYVGLVGVAGGLAIEQWPVAAGLAATGAGVIAWSVELLRRNRRARQGLDARYWEARELTNPFTVVSKNISH